MGFVDTAVNRLLRLDSRQENTIVLSAIAGNSGAEAPPIIQDEDLPIPTILPISEGKGSEYPEIRKTHQVSSLLNEDEVKRWNVSNVKNLPNKCFTGYKRLFIDI